MNPTEFREYPPLCSRSANAQPLQPFLNNKMRPTIWALSDNFESFRHFGAGLGPLGCINYAIKTKKKQFQKAGDCTSRVSLSSGSFLSLGR